MPDKSVHARQGKPSHGWAVLFSSWRPFVRAALVVALTFGLSACGSGQIRFAQEHTNLGGPVVLLGDSLGAGYGVPRGEGFADLLSARTGIAITNLSVSGLTTEGGRSRLTEDVVPLKPSLVMIELGGNDALQKVDVAVTRANLKSMIEELQRAKVPVILLGVRGGFVSDKFSGLFDGLANEYQTGYVPDLLDGILSHPELKIDSVHPNSKGHQHMADRIEPELRRVWKVLGGKL